MGVIKYLKSLLYKSDLFCSSKILRYNDEAQYATITGGLISLLIITAILFGFSSLIIETVNKTSITSTKEQIKVANPSRIKLTAGKDNFMLGFYIETFGLSQKFDLVNGPQYFDLQVSQVRIDATPTLSSIKMEQCSLDHWGHHFDVRERFQSSQINKWSCLELNRTFQLAGGGYASSIFDLLSVAVYPCINSTDNHNKCASQSQIDAVYAQHTNYYVTIAFLNTVINSNQPKPISTYLDETNYAIFSKQIGIQSFLYISDYTINTDVSILPFSDIQTISGFIAEEKAANFPLTSSNNGDPYIRLGIVKSKSSFIYDRQVLKISTVISYIGGLVGAITGIMFIFKSYTDCSLELNISLAIFSEAEKTQSNQQSQKREQDKSKEKSFSFGNYLMMHVYKLFKFFNCHNKKAFQSSEMYWKYQEEISKQLDIKILLRRMLTMESCLKQLFKNDDIKLLEMNKELSRDRAELLRSLFSQGIHEESNASQRDQINSQNIDNQQQMVQDDSLSNKEAGNKAEEMKINIPVIFEHQENHEKIKKSKQVKKQKVTLEGLQIHSTIQRKPIQSTGQIQTIRFTKKNIENLNLQEQFSHQQFTANGLLKIYEDHE